MDKVKIRPLRPYEQKKLRRLKRQKTNAVNARHARIVLLSRGGVPNRDIADRCDCTPQWVRKIIHRFNQHGLDGVKWFPWMAGTGKPASRFAIEVKERIAEVAISSPVALIGMTRWSLTKLRDYLVEQKIITRISCEWLRTLLRRMGIRWRRTKTWKESKDPDFVGKHRRIRRLYRRRPKGGRRICVDEFGPLNLLPRAGCCLTGRGKKVERHRATYNRKGGVRHLLAAYDLESGKLMGRFYQRKTWVQFLDFLKWLRRRYRKGETLHVVMDNYGSHLKREVQEWASLHKIKFYLTATNASWMNRIESQFTELKEFALKNSDYRSHEALQEAIELFMKWRNGERPISRLSWLEFKRQQKSAA
jgi:transposase